MIFLQIVNSHVIPPPLAGVEVPRPTEEPDEEVRWGAQSYPAFPKPGAARGVAALHRALTPSLSSVPRTGSFSLSSSAPCLEAGSDFSL